MENSESLQLLSFFNQAVYVCFLLLILKPRKNILVVLYGKNTMTNELLCQICGRYLAIGCNCDSLKKEICELCNEEFDDSDTLQKHVNSLHK